MIERKIEVSIYPDRRLDTENAAKYLGLSTKTLAMMRSKGTGPKYIKRGKVFYFKEDLSNWLLRDGKHTCTSEIEDSEVLML